MSLSLWTRLFNWKKLRQTAPQKMFFATIANSAPSVVQGAGVDTLITGRYQSFVGTVTPAVTGLPSGVSGSFSPSTFGAGVQTITLSLTATGGATPVVGDAFTVTLTPADTTVPVVTLNCTCTVVASISPEIAISATPTSTSALQGEADTSSTVTLVRTAFTGDVTLAASGLPTGATATFSPNPLTGGVLTSIVTVTNDIAASTVTNDAWSIDATGSGVSPASQAMTHTITSPNVTRGVPNYTGAIKYDQMSYANDAALYAASTSSASKTTMLTKQYGMTADAMLLGRTSVERGVTHNGHAVLSAVVKSDAPYVAYSCPPYITSYFSSPGIASIGAYVALKFDPGWTTRGSGTTGQTFKIWALGYSGANGRMGVEWYNGNNWSFVGTPNSASITQPSTYTNNLTGLTVNMAPGAYGNGAGANRPSNAQIDALWAAGGTLCFYTSVVAETTTRHRVKFWVWVFGSEPPANPAVDVTYTLAGGTLPGLDRISLGETFQQSLANRYAPNPCYHHWCEWGVWDLSTHPNPCGLE